MTRPDERLVRVINRGGMIVDSQCGYLVYRSSDARRGAIGVLKTEIFEQLLTDGALVETPNLQGRWVSNAPDHDCDLESKVNIAPPLPCGRKTPHKRRSLLEAALIAESDGHEREWMARGAARFIGDYERQSAAQSVTMNWAFDFGGHKGARRNGMQGMSEMSLSAQRTLGRIRDRLGAEGFQLLSHVLIERRTQRQLCVDFSTTKPELLSRLSHSLKQLARLYDRDIPAAA